MKAVNLRTEYLLNPIGIDTDKPRLMWNCEGGKKQTAYRITAVSDGKTVWDSKKVSSDSMRAEFPVALSSRERVEWSVVLWDENDNEGEPSEKAFFEVGLKTAADWTAHWITGNYTVNRRKRYPADCFATSFEASDVAKARLYVTACGLYEMKINGTKVGTFVLAPGHTDYTKRIQYQTYDVTELVKEGVNFLTAELADGWYRGSCGAWGLRNQYGTQTKLLAQLEIYSADGTVRRVCSDSDWKWSDDGAIRFADNKDGEIVDARMIPSYRGTAKRAKCGVRPVCSDNVPVTEHERFRNPEVIVTPSGKTVLDFGQNIAGYVAFSLDAKEGQRIKLRFGEMFDENGEFTQKNIQCATKKRRTPLQQIEYVCKEGRNEYKTKFAIFGFRYVSIESDAAWKPEDFTSIAVYSAMEETMKFGCSNELINKFVECTVWSAKNNHADVPTDCPTRERHGWTGDAQIFVDTASYLFAYAPFARKYIADMRDGQRKNGCFRQISPKGGIDFYMNTMDGSAGWSDAGVLIPYRMWKQYGDLRAIRDNYGAMRRYALYKISCMGKPYLTARPTGVGFRWRKYVCNYGQSYGEWAEPVDVKAFSISDFVSPHPEETTAYVVYMLERMTEIADALGKTEDGKLFAKYAEKARTGYRKLVSTPKFSLDTDRQAKLVRPLYMRLLDDKQADYAKKRLIRAMENYGWRLGTGFLSTPFILHVLQDIDIEYSYRLLENEEMPGWLFMPKSGADTIWESWEGTKAQGGVASLDHYSKGAVCEWFFSTMCGINVAGENKFVIAPCPGGTLTFAKAEYRSVYGTVSCAWKKTEYGTDYTVSVPSGTSARIVLPDGTDVTVEAGDHRFFAETK